MFVICAIAQLRFIITTPCPESAVGFDGNSVVLSGDNGLPVIIIPNLHRTVMFVSVGCSITQLTVSVIPPCPECSIGFDGNGVYGTGRDKSPVRILPNLYRVDSWLVCPVS